MTAEVQDARLAAALWECDRHRAALAEALADWHRAPTASSAELDQDSGLRRLTDQILYRFTKLQDAMGERLVPATLGWLREPLPVRSMCGFKLDHVGHHKSNIVRDQQEKVERIPKGE